MSRGKKKKVIVITGPNGFIKHKYHNNHRNVEKEKVGSALYNPKTRKKMDFADVKVKDERHSS